MGDNSFDNINKFGFSSEINPVINPVAELNKKFAEMMRPLQDVFDGLREFYTDISSKINEFSRPFIVMGKLSEAQFVYWDYLNDEFMNDIINSENIDETLLRIFINDKNQNIKNIIKKCLDNPLIKQNKRLFNQAIRAYYNQQYDLSIVGLISVFDGALSVISGEATHRLKKRLDVLTDKIEESESIYNNDVAEITLGYTFFETIESLYCAKDFSTEEPANLNRHWIIHGRSLREKTQLDCIKLINVIYGLILIDELYKCDSMGVE
jgi:hypothetical protein